MREMPPLPVDLSGIRLDPAGGLSRQLYRALRERILDGRLGGRTRLPASRDLAALLGVSRNTVTRAFDQLYAEGYIEGRVGAGTFVADLREAPAVTPPAAAAGPEPGPALRLLAEHRLNPRPEGPPRAFRVGVPAFDLFPFETWARLSARFWRRPPMHALGYGDPAGDWRLRELVAAYLRSSRGLACEPEQVLITCGSQQAISLCAQLLLQPGERVAVENPGYRAAGHAFAVAGGRLCGVPVDGEGLDTAALGASRRLPAGLCHALAPVPHGRHPVAGAASGTAGLGRTPRRLGDRGRLRRRVSLPRGAVGAAGLARPAGAGALCRHLLQDRLPGPCVWATWCCRRPWSSPSPSAARWTCATPRSAPRR